CWPIAKESSAATGSGGPLFRLPAAALPRGVRPVHHELPASVRLALPHGEILSKSLNGGAGGTPACRDVLAHGESEIARVGGEPVPRPPRQRRSAALSLLVFLDCLGAHDQRRSAENRAVGSNGTREGERGAHPIGEVGEQAVRLSDLRGRFGCR